MNELVQFESKNIRRHWDDVSEQWFFAVVDVVGVLSESSSPRRYWSDLKRKLIKEGAEQLYENIVQFRMEASDGKMRATDCADTETMMRIIQSIPSPKAEPFKMWLAQLGRERIEEATDPAIALERLRNMYLAMGHDPKWVENRLLAITVNDQLISEWERRGVSDKSDQDLLLDVISQGAFDITTEEHKAIKGLEATDDLPDNMTVTELVFKMLGEASTMEIARTQDAEGVSENEVAAKAGGVIAGEARQKLELQTGRPVVSSENALMSGEEFDNDKENR